MKGKHLIAGTVIFGTGFGAGYLICRKMLVDQYKADLEEVKDFYYNKLEEIGVMDDDFEPEAVYEQDEPDIDEEDESWEDSQERDNKEYMERVMKYSSGVRNENGNANNKGTPIIQSKPPLDIGDWGDPEEDDEDPEDIIDDLYGEELEKRAEEYAEMRYRNQLNGTPFPIEASEFDDGPDEYDKRYLYYYTGDRVLCEEDDTIVDDIEELVGLDYEDILDMQTTAWVRNDNIMVLFEIYRIDDRYDTAVQGVVETPKERDFRIRGRRKQALDDRE